MSSGRTSTLDRRLDAYFSSLRANGLRKAVKRRAANWPLYAAVTGSALALAAGAPLSLPANPLSNVAAAAIASVLVAKSFKNSLATPQAVTGQAPSIASGGVVPLCSHSGTIQPGEWVTIYGTNLASGTASWNNDFPTSLGGTQVTVNGKPAYLSFVSPGQINIQTPDDVARGTVAVVVTTSSGSATAYVTLNDYAPSFSLLDSLHVAGIILRSNHSGAYGGGTYDVVGPAGRSLGYPTVPAKPGDMVELYAVGLGPTTPAVQAGKLYSGAAPTQQPVSLYINSVFVQPTFVGLSTAGIYQINVTIPSGLGEGDVPIEIIAGGLQTQSGVVISLTNTLTSPVGGGTGGTAPVVGGTAPPGPVFFSTTAPRGGTFGGGFGGGSFGGGSGGFGGSGGGGGSGGSAAKSRHKKAPYHPVLKYPPQK